MSSDPVHSAVELKPGFFGEKGETGFQSGGAVVVGRGVSHLPLVGSGSFINQIKTSQVEQGNKQTSTIKMSSDPAHSAIELKSGSFGEKGETGFQSGGAVVVGSGVSHLPVVGSGSLTMVGEQGGDVSSGGPVLVLVESGALIRTQGGEENMSFNGGFGDVTVLSRGFAGDPAPVSLGWGQRVFRG